jgi:hypothetical protein
VFCTITRFIWGEYIVISYMWGSLEETEAITINGMPVIIGKNLAAALDRLRSNPIYKMWVDAVCIYVNRYRTKYRGNLRIGPLISEGFRFLLVREFHFW